MTQKNVIRLLALDARKKSERFRELSGRLKSLITTTVVPRTASSN